MQTFQYNPDGTLQSDGIWTYTWDAENRLVRMDSNPGGGYPSRTLEFKYDYLGRRIQKRSVSSAGDVYTRYLYDGWNVIAEYAATATTCGALSRSFTWGLDVTGSSGAAGGVGALIQITDHADGNKVYYPARDANGNIAALIAASATTAGAEPIAAAYEYSPFGELLRAEGPYAQKNPFRFSSKFTDDESGFVYYGHRYYSPTLGRFLCPDPLQEEGGTNLYAFCGNDGVNKWDYLGLWKKDSDGNWVPSDSKPTYWDNWVPVETDYSYNGGSLSTPLIRDEHREQAYNPNSSRGRLRRVTDNAIAPNKGRSLTRAEDIAAQDAGVAGALLHSLIGLAQMLGSNENEFTVGSMVDVERTQNRARAYDELHQQVDPLVNWTYGVDPNSYEAALVKQQAGGLTDLAIATAGAASLTEGVALRLSQSASLATKIPVAAESATGAFNPASRVVGDGLGKLAGRSVRVSERGINLVEQHLAQFGDVAENSAMIARLRSAFAQGAKISGADASFYLHEASEATMMGRGLLYETAHDAALLKYGVSPYSVYAPEVILANPGSFNANWLNFWGLK